MDFKIIFYIRPEYVIRFIKILEALCEPWVIVNVRSVGFVTSFILYCELRTTLCIFACRTSQIITH